MADRYLAPTGNQTIADLMKTANMYSEGWLGLGLLIIIFAVTFFALRGYDVRKSFATSCLITSISAILLRVIGIVNDLVFWVCLILAIIGFLSIFNSDRGV